MYVSLVEVLFTIPLWSSLGQYLQLELLHTLVGLITVAMGLRTVGGYDILDHTRISHRFFPLL